MPAVPVTPLGDDEHEVLLIDDQVMTLVALYAIKVGTADNDTTGAGVEVAAATVIMMS